MFVVGEMSFTSSIETAATLLSAATLSVTLSSAETFDQNYSDAGSMEDSGYSEVGKVYKDPYTGELVMVSG